MKTGNDQVPGRGTYRITVDGAVDSRVEEWFQDITLQTDERDGMPVTTITCTSMDQSGLRGMLNSLWDLNINLVSVERILQQIKQD